MIKILCIFAVIFLISVFFYKRANEEISILQIESGKIGTLSKIILELNPVVVRGFDDPPVWKKDIMSGRLGDVLRELESISKENSGKFAEESGLKVWMERIIYPQLLLPWTEYLLWPKCEAYIGPRGLWRTNAYVTVILPTDGTIYITLLTNKNKELLPANWSGKDPGTFTTNIKMVDVIVRPGSFLCVPTHWYVSVKGDAWWSILEVHHPISWICDQLAD